MSADALKREPSSGAQHPSLEEAEKTDSGKTDKTESSAKSGLPVAPRAGGAAGPLRPSLHARSFSGASSIAGMQRPPLLLVTSVL